MKLQFAALAQVLEILISYFAENKDAEEAPLI